MKKICLQSIFVIATILLLCIGQGQAQPTILADTTGNDTHLDYDFYGVEFLSGSGFIEWVSFDLTPDPPASFDFDGGGGFVGGSTAPVIGTLVGMNLSDISYNFVGSNPDILTFNFASNSFAAGDSFRFAADVDYLAGRNVNPGGDFGIAGTLFHVGFEDGTTSSATFVTINTQRSEALAIVPEPTATILFLTGFGVLGFRRFWGKR